VGEAFQKVQDALIRDYKLTKFFFLYVISRLLEEDDVGKRILESPKVPVLKHSAVVRDTVKKLAQMLVIEFNFMVDSRKSKVTYFDYKSDSKAERT
jgi:hypothetical protein